MKKFLKMHYPLFLVLLTIILIPTTKKKNENTVQKELHSHPVIDSSNIIDSNRIINR